MGKRYKHKRLAYAEARRRLGQLDYITCNPLTLALGWPLAFGLHILWLETVSSNPWSGSLFGLIIKYVPVEGMTPRIYVSINLFYKPFILVDTQPRLTKEGDKLWRKRRNQQSS